MQETLYTGEADLVFAGHIGQQIIFVTQVVLDSAMKTDGRVACQAIEVKPLVLVLFS